MINTAGQWGALFLRGVALKRDPPENSWLSDLPVVRQLRECGGLRLSKPITILVGENGSGKSTLLEAIAIALGFNPEGGSRNLHFSTKDTHSELIDCLDLTRERPLRDGFFLRAESMYNVASEIDRIAAEDGGIMNSYGGRSLHEQSHGESLLALVQNRFGDGGFYILDEPESALSPIRQMSLLIELDRLVRGGSQLLISTHSPILMAAPAAEVYELTAAGIRLTPYEQTEHFTTVKMFVNSPESMIKRLLDD